MCLMDTCLPMGNTAVYVAGIALVLTYLLAFWLGRYE